MGIGGPAGKVMPTVLILNFNGQAINLSNEDFGDKVGFREIEKVKAAVEEVAKKGRTPTFLRLFFRQREG